MVEFLNKLVGTTVRIAALIHAAEINENPTVTPISGDAMDRAIRIAKCLEGHARNAFGNMGIVGNAKYVLQKLQEFALQMPEPDMPIKKRDFCRFCHGKFNTFEEMGPVLKLLEANGYIVTQSIPTGGRPSEWIYLNPYVSGESDCYPSSNRPP